METVKLIGYYETKNHSDAGTTEYQDHDEGDVTQHFVVDLHGKLLEFQAEDSYGSCGSGYCSASWGNIHRDLIPFSGNVDLLKKPNKEIHLTLLEGKIFVTEKDQSSSYDPTIEVVIATCGTEVVSGTGNGGCNYYPSGSITLNEELFK